MQVSEIKNKWSMPKVSACEVGKKSSHCDLFSSGYRAGIMRSGWKIGNFWYFHALKSPKGLFNLFVQHIQPIFEPRRRDNGFAKMVAAYWAPDAREVVAAKFLDKKKYEEELRRLFEAGHSVENP
ncbi:hypothetical protein VE02_05833 [Pseudogymnoascus sp. 03VT05]|nr:hypothetical protein VE02_05833 [Pseudogymnoascus sp. 03VT05]